ncbi:MAG: 1-(5-phosphoribosyl)-5-((5-phosphoribosylamino)methylideneamino)imidazole-4-carboxamide isomerase, partial [Parvularculaceae bacterium]|nr:1-(5-phosphoribosyl)-5-((5-phosphoribosylamino)methylideneamino)imidazole-4-carboxamide isomerase [Parvularculaceae bacterium]
TALISLLAEKTNARIQCGGGVRTREDLVALFDSGVARAVIGSAAVKNPVEVNRWIDELGADRICCAFDVRLDGEGNFQVATDGWMKDGGVSLPRVLDAYPSGGLRHALVTDISRDGALTGPNLDLLRAVIGGWPDIAVQASGGVSSLADLEALRRLGAAGVIIGRALYEKRFTLEAALAR